MILNIDRTSTLAEDYDHVFCDDDALDSEAENFAEDYQRYIETGDRQFLHCKSGQKPTVWRMQHVRGRTKAQLQDKLRKVQSDGDGMLEAVFFAAAVALIDVIDLTDRRGDPIELKRAKDHKYGCMALSDDTIAMLSDVPGLIEDLGMRVIMELGNVGKSKRG